MVLLYALAVYVAVGIAVALAFVAVGVSQLQPMPVTMGHASCCCRARSCCGVGAGALAQIALAPDEALHRVVHRVLVAGSGFGGHARFCPGAFVATATGRAAGRGVQVP